MKKGSLKKGKLGASTPIQKTEQIDLEAVTKQEIGETLAKIKKNEQEFRDRLNFELDSGYYFSVCFRSNKERNAWLKKHGLRLRNDDHLFIEEFESIIPPMDESK